MSRTGIGSNSGLGTLAPIEQKKLKDAIKEIDASMTRIASERQLIKDIVDKISEETNVPKKLIKKAAKIAFNRTWDIEEQEHNDLVQLYQTVMGS